ncbi:hypothetical protein FSP39_004702 [Pinctada imbricata]|uniref:Uncharacterized protein n=1 Tax=Pinctada imbricata TaxID=66713 RepID=A0AA88YHF5_PINIB|nr:hypothetical protein FSP39_004702 [Pinctada imbricata]
MSIYTGRDRRKLINDTLFIEEKVDAKVESLNESCDVRTTKKCKHNHWCPEFYDVKGRTYVKFCRRVVKNFFSATLRDFRLFHKRDCWNVLKKVRLCRERRTNRHSGQTRRRRRRHHHGPSRGKRSDQVVDFDKILPRCVPT